MSSKLFIKFNSTRFFTLTLYHLYRLKHEIPRDVQGLHWCRWYKIDIPCLSTCTKDNPRIVDRKHFIKYWPVWFEHCGYMWHICLPNASQSHVIRPIGWFNIVYQARHHVSLKRFHAENVFKNVLVQTIWSVYGWIPLYQSLLWFVYPIWLDISNEGLSIGI